MITQELLRALFELRADGTLVRKVDAGHTGKAGAVVGSPNKAGYLRTCVAGKLYYNHRLIWFMVHGTWPELVDHINGNRADNRIENLRECSHTGNMRNMAMRKDSATGVKGVNWRPAKRKYRARIVVDRKEISLGHYVTLEEAAQAVREARAKYHGEFARHV